MLMTVIYVNRVNRKTYPDICNKHHFVTIDLWIQTIYHIPIQ